ncbi:ATP-dependent helicase/deoxyribonuclease subunit B [Vallitalea longa]|uniref:ATP-dependent helicase/deoxyribonuclease subunit B n=1 Tax=Vallitalea longa TaxID=2936439 RepID=A0A9W6DGS5_9FIRM|nr:helicase-exonuclease AddAB subunit AddB [Vallitalea longa]GKX30842.1 ATP-dependent helicase/deoxyribonuclease subunit B [Vallitalea longa]
MSLQYILGCAGSGKTYYCYNSIIKESLTDINKPLIMIVPEQFTLETQKDIVKLHPSSGIMQIEILSFQRLAYRIFDEIGGANKTLLGNTGKGMVIRKVIEDNKENLKLFYRNSTKPGFIKELKSVITELYQYDISAKNLNDSMEKLMDKPLLQTKINDLQIVYNGFQEYIKKDYITNEETLDILSESISKSNLLSEATIWIDGFYGFTPIQYKLLNEIVKKVEKTYITLTIDNVNTLNDLSDESELFYETKKAVSKLNSFAKESKVKVLENIVLHNTNGRYENKALEHLEKNIFRYPYKVYNDQDGGIHVYTAPNIRKEVVTLANNIIDLVKENNYRYREIAVVTGDLNGYEKIISQCFREYDIPFFIDKKKDIMSNPFVELIRAAISIIDKGFTYETIFRYLKTYLTSVPVSDIDIIENYVLAYGIKGRKQWENEFEYPFINNKDNSEYADKQLQRINMTRTRIIEPLLSFKNNMGHKKAKVKTITQALYNLISELDIEQKLFDISERFRKNDELLLEKEYKVIFKLVMELLDNIVDILGDEEITLQEYSVILESGLEQCEMGLVPPGLDQIVVGDLERSRLREIKALFIVGLNEGKIPKISVKANILSDTDKDKLLDKGIELSPNSKKKVFEEQFLIYVGLTKPSEKLFLSYPRTDIDGKSIRPSILISRIKKIFMSLQVIDIEYIDDDNIYLQKPTFRKMLSKLRDYYSNGFNSYWKDIYSWYYTNNTWKDTLEWAVNGLYHVNKENSLSDELVTSIYTDTLVNSVSRLEEFSQCPFAHFLDYGLHVSERVVREITLPDIGILFHRSIDEFSKKLNQRELDWKDLKDEDRNKLVEETVIQIADKYCNNIFYSTGRNAYLIKRLTRITKRAVWALQYHIRKGEFKPTDYEVAFDPDKGDIDSLKIDFDDEKTMKLKGRIDRVDRYETDDTIYVKVIDYKSGNKQFDIAALYYGLQLQLLVYLNAVTELEEKKTTKKIVPAGVFYYHIDDPIIKTDSEIDSDELQEQIIKSLKMNGLVLKDIDIINKMDNDINNYSNIIPVQITKKGQIGKRSSVASEEQFGKLMNYVQHKAEEIGQEIMNGNILIYPYKNSKGDACQYCKYSSICQFDSSINGNEYRILENIDKNDVWKKIDKS